MHIERNQLTHSSFRLRVIQKWFRSPRLAVKLVVDDGAMKLKGWQISQPLALRKCANDSVSPIIWGLCVCVCICKSRKESRILTEPIWLLSTFFHITSHWPVGTIFFFLSIRTCVRFFFYIYLNAPWKHNSHSNLMRFAVLCAVDILYENIVYV